MKRRGASPMPRAFATLLLAACAPLAVRAATTTIVTPDTLVYSPSPFVTPIKPGEKMLVEASQVVYDLDNKTVAAVGSVRIYYGQYTLTADRVTYNEITGKLVADGRVRLVDPLGNEFQSTHIDVTANFRDAFVASLKVATPQQTRFEADSATRKNGETTTFVNAMYTACEACAEHPEKPPLWNVRAATIVLNEKEHTVSFTDARLEFLGRPIASIPYFTIPDDTVKRKSGFLWPLGGYKTDLGVSLSVPYFWALAPSYDLTFAPAVYSRQGFLAEAEWRQRLDNGEYSIHAAGINQQDKSAFDAASPSYRDLRGGVRTVGDFAINTRWAWGWDATLLSDRNFTQDYDLLSNEKTEIVSDLRLTGLDNRNYFQTRASAYQILTDPSTPGLIDPARFDQGRQAVAVPVVDYRRVSDRTPHGGEVTLTTNVANLVRQEDDPFQANAPMATFYQGTAGTTVRATQQVTWQREIVGAGGQIVTPFAYLRGDAFFLDQNTAAPITSSSTAFRAMPAAGIELSYPMLVRGPAATQIIEPKAQLIVRPNEVGIGTLPNNDAQSLAFDVASLFDWDKFSGYDRTEGGGRLNLGLHYSGAFASGVSVDGTFGQSFQVLGLNSFAIGDVANVGPYSGLDTRSSDYVGAVKLDTGIGPSLEFAGRFDEKTFRVNRAEVSATAALGPVTASAAYFYLRQNPNNDLSPPTGLASVVHGAASVNLSENWRAFGSFAYDIAQSAIASNSVGVAFDNSCVTFAVSYNETRRNYLTTEAPDRQIKFRLELRTLGEGNASANLNSL